MSMVSELFSVANKMTPFRAHGGPDRRELLFLFGFDDLVASMAAKNPSVAHHHNFDFHQKKLPVTAAIL
ncbi:hypothetical protein Lal_00011329 [Lupinus albus]|nr:hypothetical protein Lal_00011329 [Lupinus albus]